MPNINKIRLSGNTYTVQDLNAAKTVELTQAQYDALTVKDPNTFYIITDAEPVDMSDYYTKSETSGATEISTALASKADTATTYTKTEVDTALGAKQATLVSGTNIKTVNNESLLGEGNIEIQGGGAEYSAGDGIDITNDVISVTGKVDTSAFTAHTADTVIHVTSAEKAAWNAKSDFSGDYNDLTNKPTIPTVPTSNTAFTNDAGYITSDAISGKADTSAVTESINAAVSGKVDTSTYNTYTAATDTALASKQTTLTAGTGISIVDNVISATGGGGGGKAISAGTNISITTGETADTINCTIPAYFNSDEQKGDIAIGTRINNTHSDYYKVIIGRQIDTYGNANSSYSVGIAPSTNNSSFYSQLKGNNSVGIGKYFQITGHQSVAIGSEAKSSVAGGVAIGYQANASGTTKMNLNNQIKVDTNNQVYIKDKDNVNEVCIQDAIAALGGLKLVKLTQTEYDALATKDSNTLYVIVN